MFRMTRSTSIASRQPTETSRYVVCLSNRGYAASLVVRRLYRVIDDPVAAKRGLVRVIDESREDFLYPKTNETQDDILRQF